MEFDPAQLSPGRLYATMTGTITPRPIAWVSTQSARGIPNLAPFSYFAGVGSQPPALMISVVNRPDGSLKDTVRNIQTNRQFVVNLVTESMAAAMVATSQELDYEVSEFEHCGLTPSPSARVTPPFVLESPVQFECELLQIAEIGSGPLAANAIFGRIVWLRVADELLDQLGQLKPNAMQTIGRLGGSEYCTTRDRFEIKRA